MENHLETD